MIRKILFALLLLNLAFITIFNGIELTYYAYVSIALTFISLVLFAIEFKKEGNLSVEFKNPLIFLFIGVIVLNLFFSKNRSASFFAFYEIITGILTFLILSSIFDEKSKTTFVKLLSVFGFAFSLAGIFEYFNYVAFPNSELSQFLVRNGFIQGTRVASFFQYPNAYGGFLTFFLFISLGLLLSTNGIKEKILYYLESIAFIFSIYLTDSRGAYLSVILAFIFLFVTFRLLRRNFLEIVISIASGIILILLNNMFVSPIVEERASHAQALFKFILGMGDTALSGRVELFKDALNIFRHNILFGTGLNTFRDAIFKYWVGYFFAADPHSLFARLLAETGLLGTLTFFSFILFEFVRAIKESRQKDLIYPFVLVALLSLLIHINLDLDFQYLSIILLFFIGLSLILRSKKFQVSQQIKDVVFLSIVLISIFVLVVDIVPQIVASVYASAGESFLNKGDYESAFKDFKVATSIVKNNPEYLTNFANACIGLACMNTHKEENLTTAINALTEANKLNKLSFFIPLRLSRIYLYLSNPNAIGYAGLALDRAPRWKPIESELALSLAFFGKDIDKAKVLSQDALTFNIDKSYYDALHYITPEEKDSIALTALGFASLNDFELSKTYFNKAISLWKENAFAYYGLSRLYEKQGNLMLEVENLYSAIRLNLCIKDAYERYFSVAPLIKVETDISKEDLKKGSEINLRFSIVRNEELLLAIEVYIEKDGVSTLEKECSPYDNSIMLKVPSSNSFRIIIAGVDKNNNEIVRVTSLKLYPK